MTQDEEPFADWALRQLGEDGKVDPEAVDVVREGGGRYRVHVPLLGEPRDETMVAATTALVRDTLSRPGVELTGEGLHEGKVVTRWDVDDPESLLGN